MSNVLSTRDVDILIEGDGAETILMVHGWPDTYRLWDAQVQFFKEHYRCVRFTLPGFDVARARRAYSLDEVTFFFKQLVEEVAPRQKVILMAHDWGCAFSYEFYMRNPQMVSRIIGVDVGDRTSLQQSRTLRDWMMVFAYQGWLALAWVIGRRIGDWMTRFMARVLRCPLTAGAHRVADELSVLHALVRWPEILSQAGAAVYSDLSNPVHLRQSQAVHVPCEEMGG